MSDLAVLPQLLVCPDDHGVLQFEHQALRCDSCGRLFPRVSHTYWDFRPAKPLEKAREFGEAYFTAYRDLFEREHPDFSGIPAWGAAASNPTAWVQKRERHRRAILSLLRSGADTSKSVLVDVSAGAGFYTTALAPHFQYVLHCDLSAASLTYSSGLSQELGITNIVFLRVDYLSLPFHRSLTHVLCLDSLIRGDRHDLHVLGQIAGSLRGCGSAMVDFHNWWHNPIRRLGLLAENFHNNRSYSRREAEALLQAADLGIKRYQGFVQEGDSDKKMGRMVSGVLPPTRFLYVVQSARPPAVSEPVSSAR